MYHHFDSKVFTETSSNTAKFLMLCPLRRALRGTDQFKNDAKGIILCIVEKAWIWYAKSAANVLMTGGPEHSFYDDFGRPVHIIGETPRRMTSKGIEDFTVFAPADGRLSLGGRRG